MADHPRDDGNAGAHPRLDVSPSRDQLVAVLEHIGHRPVEGPSVDFVDRLEQQLLEGTTTIASIGPRSVESASRAARHRRRARAVAALTVIGTLAAGSAAAAVITHDRHEPTVITPAAPGTIDDEPTATTVSDRGGESTTSMGTEPVTTGPSAVATGGQTVSTTRPATATIVAPTSVPAEERSQTTAPTTTATTEGHGAPLSLTIGCASTTTTIVCTWSASSFAHLAGYRVLRAVPGESQGRVFSPEPSALSYSDATAVAGVTYGYRVQALDGSGNVIEQSTLTPATLA